jgi:hypothetical protein
MQKADSVSISHNFIKLSRLLFLPAFATDVFQFLITTRFLETSRANRTAHQLVVATGMTPFYQIFSYHACYIENGTAVTIFMLVPCINDD